MEDLEEEPALPLPDWQQEILDERIAEDDADPDGGSPWDEVKQRILASLAGAEKEPPT
ncbi:MAG TPA: addiction module protein [Thermoanaerobaculia bacterium]|nr:addiction module protein [Thermoanaerobaculia bacterium]